MKAGEGVDDPLDAVVAFDELDRCGAAQRIRLEVEDERLPVGKPQHVEASVEQRPRELECERSLGDRTAEAGQSLSERRAAVRLDPAPNPRRARRP